MASVGAPEQIRRTDLQHYQEEIVLSDWIGPSSWQKGERRDSLALRKRIIIKKQVLDGTAAVTQLRRADVKAAFPTILSKAAREVMGNTITTPRRWPSVETEGMRPMEDKADHTTPALKETTFPALHPAEEVVVGRNTMILLKRVPARAGETAE